MSKNQKKDHRKSNLSRRMGVREIKQSFLIVCEGENTEPDYFKAFRMTAATIMAVGHGFGALMYRFLLSRQRQAIDNAEVILAEVSHGNPAQEESSTTVQKLVVELNKYL